MQQVDNVMATEENRVYRLLVQLICISNSTIGFALCGKFLCQQKCLTNQDTDTICIKHSTLGRNPEDNLSFEVRSMMYPVAIETIVWPNKHKQLDHI
jgi:hypothetical protein